MQDTLLVKRQAFVVVALMIFTLAGVGVTKGGMFFSLQPAPAPDLIVTEIVFEKPASQIRVSVLNQGTATSSSCVLALQTWTKEVSSLPTKQRTWNIAVPALEAGKEFSKIIDVAPLNQTNGPWDATVDRSNTVAESNENNNTLRYPPRIKTGGGESTKIPLAMELWAIDELWTNLPGEQLGKQATYRVKIGTPHPFPADWYTEIEVLPPTFCGKKTYARLLLNIRWKLDKDSAYEKAGLWKVGVCKPLKSPQDLEDLAFSLNKDHAIPDHLMVVVQDRLTGIVHTSNDFPVGAFGVASALHSVGCTAFLGRWDEFICTKQAGFQACQNLKVKGKPIKCTLMPPKQ
jgi:hypothetical protein